MTPKIAAIRLRCQSPEGQARFYRDVLGMRDRDDGTIGYGDQEAGLIFEQAEHPYEPTQNDLYWKIAISVPDLDLAHRQLAAKGIAVDSPRQVLQIAYLAHVHDPEGFTIELLDHRFKGDRPDLDLDSSRLGGGPHLSLLTLRTGDIASSEKACLGWGMKPLMRADIPEFGFNLHFYAFTNEDPPSPDLHAIENRPWTYQRPYTVLELQSVEGREIAKTREGASGYVGADVSDPPSTLEDGMLGLS